MKRALLLMSVGLLLPLTPRAQMTAPSAAGDARFRQAFADFTAAFDRDLKTNGIVGGSIVLVRHGQAAASHYAGSATLEPARPVDPDTIYHWASITKTLTSIAIMQLRDRGRLSLDDPIVKYIPELREVRDPFGDVREITLRHLMSHSAGFRSATWPWGGDKDWHPPEPTRWDQLVAMLPYTEILFKPGSKYSYSNPGVVFLGRVIELLTGDDYEVYVDKNIFKPLGMYRSYFDRTPYYLLPHRSASYFVTDGLRRPARFDFDTGITTSNGGWNAPLGDLVKYLGFLMDGQRGPGATGQGSDLHARPAGTRHRDQGVGTADQESNRPASATDSDSVDRTRYDMVLKRSSLEEMWVPQLPVSSEDSDRVAIGLAFFVEDYDGIRYIAHSGGQEGFISHFYFDPAARVGYVVAFNTEATTSGKNGTNLTRALDTAVRQRVMRDLLPILR